MNNYRLEVYSKSGRRVTENCAQYDYLEEAVESFIKWMESCIGNAESRPLACAVLDKLQDEYTIKHRRIYDDWDEFHPCYRDYTIIQVQLDSEIKGLT